MINQENSQQHYLNVTLESEKKENSEEVILSFSGIIRQLKRFLLIWLAVSIVVGVLVPAGYAIFASDQHKNLSALVSFNYDGIEKGKAPDGSTFDPYSIKNPAVIEKALTSLGQDLTELESIRQGISIEGIIPADAQDKITMYKSIYEQGNLNAGERMLEVKVNPTQFKVLFNYSKTSFQGRDAVELFNTILTCYSEYFFETYGFNQALGSAVMALDYEDYDYAQAIDVFDSTLSTLQDYVNSLSSEDTTRFRSNTTGYTFADLSKSISTIREVDLDVISSYITVNTVTKDKNTLLSYYNYRIENLERQKKIAEDELKVVTDSLEKYEKDTIIIYGENQDTSQYTQASVAYDDLINRKINAQKSVSTYAQKIDQYQKRVNDLNGKNAANNSKMKKVEEDLESLSTKISELLKKVNDTANDYYETVYLSNSYSILVPASTSALVTTKSIIKAAMEPLLILEALIFVAYFGVSFMTALVIDTRKKREQLARVSEMKTANPHSVLTEPVKLNAVNPSSAPVEATEMNTGISNPAPAESAEVNTTEQNPEEKNNLS